MTGRPTLYTPELGDAVCAHLAEGWSLRKICLGEDTPHVSTVMDWVLKGADGDDRYSAFAEQYARARKAQAELLADELMDIADDSASDVTEDGDGNEVTRHDVIQRARLRVDTRKWYLSKVLAKKYGDKLAIGGDPDAPPVGVQIYLPHNGR